MENSHTFLPLDTPVIYVGPEEWSWIGILEVEFLSQNILVGLPLNGDLVHPFLNMYICLVFIMIYLGHIHGLHIFLDVWSSYAFSKVNHFKSDKEHCVLIHLSILRIISLVWPQH